MDVKHKDMVKLLERNGWWFKRSGRRHDIYTNGNDIEPIPRHAEINENLVNFLIKKHGLK